MAKRIKEIHDQMNLLTAKGRTGYHSAEDIDIAVFRASKELYNEYYKLYEDDNQLSDSMDVFLSDPTTLTLVSGRFTLPTDFMHEIGEITAGTSNKSIKRITHAQLAKRVNSSLVPPTIDYPICAFYKSFIQFYPSNITNVIMTYLKKPVQPIYATTIVDGREVYDDASSVDIEWNETDTVKITNKTLSVLGINLDKESLVQYAEAKSKLDD